ncbi:3-oxoacyl-[acyl-carrier-protein] synthase, KASII, partial [hydrothermal vent metagenome]
MNKRRVVVTGLGIISPVGSGIDKFWNALKEGKSGVGPITQFDAAQFTCKIAAEVKDYNPLDHFSTKEARNLARFVQFASVASKEALINANLKVSDTDAERVGVLVGSGIGSIETAEVEYQKYIDKGPRRISPHFIPKIIINEAAGQVSIDTGALGPATCITTACSTATNAIGDAFRCIQYGDCDVMIAGGTESATSILGVGGFCSLKALTTRNDSPETASRPFDLNRDGFIMG